MCGDVQIWYWVHYCALTDTMQHMLHVVNVGINWQQNKFQYQYSYLHRAAGAQSTSGHTKPFLGKERECLDHFDLNKFVLLPFKFLTSFYNIISFMM